MSSFQVEYGVPANAFHIVAPAYWKRGKREKREKAPVLTSFALTTFCKSQKLNSLRYENVVTRKAPQR